MCLRPRCEESHISQLQYIEKLFGYLPDVFNLSKIGSTDEKASVKLPQ